jgi:hypothetical protein
MQWNVCSSIHTAKLGNSCFTVDDKKTQVTALAFIRIKTNINFIQPDTKPLE